MRIVRQDFSRLLGNRKGACDASQIKGSPASHMRHVFVKRRSTTRAGLVSCGRRELCGMACLLRTAHPERRAGGGRGAAGLGSMQAAKRRPQQHGAPGRGRGIAAQPTDEALPWFIKIGPRRFPVPRHEVSAWRCGGCETFAGQHAQPSDAARGQVNGPVKRAIPAGGASLIFEGGVAIMGHR